MAKKITFSKVSNSEEDSADDDEDVRKHLDFAVQDTPLRIKSGSSQSLDKVDKDAFNVFVRLKPFTRQDKQQGEDQKCLEVVSDQILIAHAPMDSHAFKMGLAKQLKFEFTKIFKCDSSQKEFFEETMASLMKSFVAGQNCLVFTFGVTNSGKTYTIQGEHNDAGILPRALDFIFSSVKGRQLKGCHFKPSMFSDVVRLSVEQQEQEKLNKEKLLKLIKPEDALWFSDLSVSTTDSSAFSNESLQSDASTLSSGSSKNAEGDSPSIAEDQSSARIKTSAQYIIWVSFAEIYNELIFDLLEMTKKNDRRKPLHLKDDKNGVPFIRGLQEVCVNTVEEAWKVLAVGKENLQFATTKLNHNSSRSHCIFTIKLIRVMEDARQNEVCMLSFCDLAGSERYSKTGTFGDRIKEAGNINTSLLCLSRCITTMRRNQMHIGQSQIVPFRESKLTRVFHSFFCGRGQATMIVNVSQCASLFDETLQALKYSSLAKELQLEDKRLERTSSCESQFDWQSVELSELDLGDEDTVAYIKQLQATIVDLQQKIKLEREDKMKNEIDVRNEVVDNMSAQIRNMEKCFSEQLQESRLRAEERLQRKIEMLTAATKTNKRKRLEDDDDEEETVPLTFLQAEKRMDDLEMQLKQRDEQIDKLLKERDELRVQVSTMTFQQAALPATASATNISSKEKCVDTKNQYSQTEVDDPGSGNSVEEVGKDEPDTSVVGSRLEKSRCELEEVLKDLQGCLCSAKDESVALQAELQTLRERNRTLEHRCSELEEKCIEMDLIEGEYNALLEKHDRLRAELVMKEKEHQEIRYIASDHRAEISRLHTEFEKKELYFSDELAQREQEIRDLKKSLRSTQKKEKQIDGDSVYNTESGGSSLEPSQDTEAQELPFEYSASVLPQKQHHHDMKIILDASAQTEAVGMTSVASQHELKASSASIQVDSCVFTKEAFVQTDQSDEFETLLKKYADDLDELIGLKTTVSLLKEKSNKTEQWYQLSVEEAGKAVDNLEVDNGKLMKKIAKSNEKLKVCQAELKNAEEKSCGFEKEVFRLQLEAEDINALKEKVDGLQLKLQDKDTQFEGQQKKKLELERTIDKMKNELQKCTKEKEAGMSEKLRLEESVKDFVQECWKLELKGLTNSSSLADVGTALKFQKGKKQDEEVQAGLQTHDLKEENRTLKEKVQELNAELSAMNDKMEDSRQREVNLKTRVKEMSGNLTQQIQEIAVLHDNVKRYKSSEGLLFECQALLEECKNKKDEIALSAQKEKEKLLAIQTSLEKELEKTRDALKQKEDTLEVKNLKINDLLDMLQKERIHSEISTRDAIANQTLVEKLREAVNEQERVMLLQDQKLVGKEKEINDIAKDLEDLQNKQKQQLAGHHSNREELQKKLEDQSKLQKQFKVDADKWCTEANENARKLEVCQTEKTALEMELEQYKAKRPITAGTPSREYHLLKTKFQTLDETNVMLKARCEQLETEGRKAEEQLANWRSEKDKLVSHLGQLLKDKDKQIEALQSLLQEKQSPVKNAKRTRQKAACEGSTNADQHQTLLSEENTNPIAPPRTRGGRTRSSSAAEKTRSGAAGRTRASNSASAVDYEKNGPAKKVSVQLLSPVHENVIEDHKQVQCNLDETGLDASLPRTHSPKPKTTRKRKTAENNPRSKRSKAKENAEPSFNEESLLSSTPLGKVLEFGMEAGRPSTRKRRLQKKPEDVSPMKTSPDLEMEQSNSIENVHEVVHSRLTRLRAASKRL